MAQGISAYIPTQQYEEKPSLHPTDRLLMKIKPEVLCRFMVDESTIPQIFYSPRNGTILASNKSLSALLGYQPDELSGKSITELFHPEDRRFEQESLQECYQTRTTATHSVKRCWTKSGETTLWIVFSSKCAMSETGEILFVMATLQDITVYKQNESQVMNVIGYFEQRLMEMSEKIVALQAQVRDVLTYKKKIADAVSHEFRTPLTAIQSGCEILHRYYSAAKNPDIEKRFVTIYNNIQTLTSILDNILELDTLSFMQELQNLDSIRANEGITKAKVVAAHPIEQADENLRMFMHDLQTPLTRIILTTSSIERNWTKMNLPSIRDSLRLVEQTGKQMKSMITRFLEASSVESLMGHRSLQPVDFAAATQSVIQDIQTLALSKNITLNFYSTPHNTLVLADIHLLKRIIDNILSNAVKYSFKGSVIEIRLKEVLQKRKKWIALEVKDYGQGIKEGEMPFVFTKYSRLSARPTGGEPSTGLGLWIVKQLVTTMRGTVECNSTWGKGTLFTVRLTAVEQSS